MNITIEEDSADKTVHINIVPNADKLKQYLGQRKESEKQ